MQYILISLDDSKVRAKPVNGGEENIETFGWNRQNYSDISNIKQGDVVDIQFMNGTIRSIKKI